MTMLRVELPVRPSGADLAALQAEMAAYGHVDELPPVSYDFQSFALGVSFVSDALQAIDVLVNWLSARIQSTPRVHQAVIRLSDGSRFELKSDNEETFRAALKAAIEKL